MKTFTFRYDPMSTLKCTMDKMIRAAKTGKPYVEKDQIRSASLNALLSVATENRLNLFRLIHRHRPASIYDLAKIFGGDLSYVSKEVKVLEGLGLIKLKKDRVKGRERLKPVALYDRIVVDFDLANDEVS